MIYCQEFTLHAVQVIILIFMVAFYEKSINSYKIVNHFDFEQFLYVSRDVGF